MFQKVLSGGTALPGMRHMQEVLWKDCSQNMLLEPVSSVFSVVF